MEGWHTPWKYAILENLIRKTNAGKDMKVISSITYILWKLS